MVKNFKKKESGNFLGYTPYIPEIYMRYIYDMLLEYKYIDHKEIIYKS